MLDLVEENVQDIKAAGIAICGKCLPMCGIFLDFIGTLILMGLAEVLTCPKSIL